MTLSNLSKTPFPYFGGKADAADHVWSALGDVDHYIEPFAGSLAVLLRRPHLCNRPYYSETVNDADGLLVNVWRAIQMSPNETAKHASWPVSEADLHARHYALVKWRSETQLEHLMGDPSWHDPIMAGWWIWGTCCWIGAGFASGCGPWIADASGRLVRRSAREPGVSRTLPHLSDGGRGANHPGTREPGVGDIEYRPIVMPELIRWFEFLSARLRHVRILNGDWSRLVTGGASKTLPVRQGGVCGVFLDPPYSAEANRDENLYAHENLTVSHDVREWCLANGDDPQYRIVLAGYDAEHSELESHGWRCAKWYKAGFLRGGMANISGKSQQNRERLWLSPHCLDAKENMQKSLFDCKV